MAQRILVASYTPNISTLEFNPDVHTLKPVAQSPAGMNPSWVASHPTDKSLILATNEVDDGKVHLFRLHPDGKLKLLESVGSAGQDPAHLAVLEDEVIVGNYSSGNILAFPLSTKAPHFLSASAPIQLTGSGPHESRQKSPHPHQIFPYGDELFVADLGSDRIVRFKKNDKREWAEVGEIKTKPGAGPRHVQIYDGVLYVIDELTNTLTAHSLSTPSKELASLSTLASPPKSTSNSTDSPPLPLLAAELLLVKKPKPLLFATNRNETDPEGDSISVYSPIINGDVSTFKLVNSVRTGLNHARGAAFGGQDDKWLVVGGSDKGGAKVFERSGENLTVVASLPGVVAPTGFLWV